MASRACEVQEGDDCEKGSDRYYKKKKKKEIESLNLAWSQGTIVKNLPSLYILQQTIQK